MDSKKIVRRQPNNSRKGPGAEKKVKTLEIMDLFEGRQ